MFSQELETRVLTKWKDSLRTTGNMSSNNYCVPARATGEGQQGASYYHRNCVPSDNSSKPVVPVHVFACPYYKDPFYRGVKIVSRPSSACCRSRPSSPCGGSSKKIITNTADKYNYICGVVGKSLGRKVSSAEFCPCPCSGEFEVKRCSGHCLSSGERRYSNRESRRNSVNNKNVSIVDVTNNRRNSSRRNSSPRRNSINVVHGNDMQDDGTQEPDENLQMCTATQTKATQEPDVTLDNLSGIKTQEATYIEQLQEHVYNLELETACLRGEITRANSEKSEMEVELKTLVDSVKELKTERESEKMKNVVIDTELEQTKAEKENILKSLSSETECYQAEIDRLQSALTIMKIDNDELRRSVQSSENQMKHLTDALRSDKATSTRCEDQLYKMRVQFEHKCNELELARGELEEKRSELLRAETSLQQLEGGMDGPSKLHDKLIQDLRDELNPLREKLKEAEMNLDKDKFLREKESQGSVELVKENASLSQQILELKKQLDAEKQLRESTDDRKSKDVSDMVVLREREKSLAYELRKTKELLMKEEEKIQQLKGQLQDQEIKKSSMDISMDRTKSRLAEIEQVEQCMAAENAQLRNERRKSLEDINQLRSQIDEYEKEICMLHNRLHFKESRIKELEGMKCLESSLQSTQWREYTAMHDSTKTMSQLVRSQSPPRLSSKDCSKISPKLGSTSYKDAKSLCMTDKPK